VLTVRDNGWGVLEHALSGEGVPLIGGIAAPYGGQCFDTGASLLQFVGELYYLLIRHHHQLMLGADRALAWFVPPTRTNR